METQLRRTNRSKNKRHDSRIFIELVSSDLKIIEVVR